MISEHAHSPCVIAHAGPPKETNQTVVLPSAANELANQSACIDKLVEQNNIVPNANPVAATTDPSSNKTPPLSTNEQIKDLSLGTAMNLASPSKDTSNNRYRTAHGSPSVANPVLTAFSCYFCL